MTRTRSDGPNGPVLFAERRRPPRAIDIVTCVLMTACVVSVPFLWTLAGHVVLHLLLVICMVVFPVLAMCFHSRILVDARRVRLALVPVWRRTIPREEIVAASARRMSPRQLGGFGLRRTTDGALGLVMRGQEAVEITLTSGRRYVLGADDPAALLRSLSESLPTEERKFPSSR